MKTKLALIFTVFWIVGCSTNSGNNQSDVKIQEEMENEGLCFFVEPTEGNK